MKPKLIFWIMAVMMTFLLFCISLGADRFYYGSYKAVELGPEQLSWQKDSLKFNIGQSLDIDSTNVDSFAKYSMRAIPENEITEISPMYWAKRSHYTLWEAEGLPGSYYKLSYSGGTLVNDSLASGGKAMKFGANGTPRIRQTGPSYYQERGADPYPIEYTAEFRLKYGAYTNPPRDTFQPPPPTVKVCSLIVVDTEHHTILKDTTLDNWDFVGLGDSYKTFPLTYTVAMPESNKIEFQIYLFWFDGYLYTDYVKVYDNNGRNLIDLRQYDQRILDYVSQPWVHTTMPGGDTVVYRWYLRDQPKSVDCFEPHRYISSLLRTVSTERVGNEAFCDFREDTLAHEYFLRRNPKEYIVDPYPTQWWGPDSSGKKFREGMDTLTKWLNVSKNDAETWNKDLWVTIQTFWEGDRIPPGGSCFAGCSLFYDGSWYCSGYKRLPTPNEVRLQTFLALCYGADAILNFCYPSFFNYNHLMLGLYDLIADTATGMWREIKNFTGPRMEKLGPISKQLTWQGACTDDSVGSFILRNGQPSYIYDIVPQKHYPPHVEVGFFRGPYMGEEKMDREFVDYFMLVNRRCLSSEGDSFRVFIETDDPDWWYGVEDMYSGSTVEIPRCGWDPQFTVSLGPGEGKLFRLFQWYSVGPRYIHVGPGEEYATIQAGIDAAVSGQVVLVDTGTYYENIKFTRIGILVTSKFHTTGDTSYISRTIIDGSDGAKSDSGSVVRFVSGENSCACINGFTLKNGTGTITSKEPTARKGGGILCYNSSPTISNNIIISNRAEPGSGGGIYCNSNSSPRIISNIIKGNFAGYGGGISGGNSGMVITNNLILQDTASGGGGGIDIAGAIITNNTITEDSAGLHGGGIHVLGANSKIANNIIVNCKTGRGTGTGGGIYTEVIPNTISYNDVWNNIGGNFEGYFCWRWGDTSWGTNRNGTPCDSLHNIIQDPIFVDGYHLDDSSLCIDAGDNNAPGLPATDFDGNRRVADDEQNDTFFVDMGAYEYPPEGYKGFGKIVGSDRNNTETRSSGELPDKFSLLQNYPNPFNPTTVVKFKIPQPAKVSLKIYNLLGQLVRILMDEEKPPGTYQVIWDGKDDEGKEVASGIYFYQLTVEDRTLTKKMLLLR